MNKVILIGNLTKDPELTQTPTGVSLCKFSLAVSRRYAGADGSRETDFFNIVVWRAQAENCAKYLKKGSRAAIVGSIQNRTYDAPDGTKKYITDIVADEVQFLTTKNESFDEEPKPAGKVRPPISQLEAVDEDLPF